MKFSILIAHYQNWEYFQQCYQSLLDQTCKDFEIIIVDDCSQDDSYQKLQELAALNPAIQLYQNQENKGVGFTKNRLLSLATGDIFGFVDPDDALEKTALEEMKNSYENNPSIVAVYSQMLLCDDDLQPLRLFERTSKIPANDQLFVNINTSIAHFFTLRKEAFQQIENIDITLKSAVDQDLYLKLYEVGPFYFLPKPLYLYRLHEKGVSQQKNKDSAKDDFKKVIRNTLERRGVEKLDGKLLQDLSNDEVYQILSKRENSLFKKLQRKIGW